MIGTSDQPCGLAEACRTLPPLLLLLLFVLCSISLVHDVMGHAQANCLHEACKFFF